MKSGATANVSLKSGNFRWLCSLAIVDVLAISIFVFPEIVGGATLTQITAARAAMTIALPMIVLLLSALLSPNIKASLVYWKGRAALPGHEAFTRHGPSDTRIDMGALRKNVGVIPSLAADQNVLWYKLYKKVDSEVSVIEAHRTFLLFRDMASVSALLVFLVPAGLYLNGTTATVLWSAAALFSVQYLVAAVAARNSGIRFVTNVLAIHSSRKVLLAKPTS